MTLAGAAAAAAGIFPGRVNRSTRMSGFCAVPTRLQRLTVLLMLTFALSGVALASPSPRDVVVSSANEVARRLENRREYLAEHPDELYALVDEVLLPNFDIRYAGFLVLGPHWRTITEEQRDRFLTTFFDFLVRSYSRGLLDFDPKSLVILDVAAPPADEKRVQVKTTMRQDDGSIVPVNYSLRSTAKGWKVYDVRIEGVSYLQNYRNQFNAEISANGIESVISRLEQETADVASQAE